MHYGKLVIQIILLILFMELLERMSRRDFPKILKYSLMVVLGIIYFVAIAVLGFYAVTAVSEGIFKRMLAGICALSCLVFILYQFRKILKSS